MFFKRKNRKQAGEAEPTAAAPSGEDQAAEEPTAEPEAAQVENLKKANGPFDIRDIDNPEDYLNFGAVLVKPIPGLKVRMDIEEKTKRVVSISLEVADSRVQLQAFAAAKSEALWPGISNKIAEDIAKQNGEIFNRDGEHGKELLAKVPQQLPDGRSGHVALRFVGVDGPRWFLRAVVGGAAIGNEEASKIVDELLRTVVVDRGDKPMPPAELLTLNVPSNATTRADTPAPTTEPPVRGPEITQIG